MKDSLSDKTSIAIDRIKTLSNQSLYVAFSGGKDSTVLLDLVQRAGVPYDAHYNVTTVDPPELIRFIQKYYPYVFWERPEETMWQLIVRKEFPPMRIKRYCCGVLKEGGGTGRLVATGIRWEESKERKNRKMVEQCFKDGSRIYLNPIIDWTTEEIWQYIYRHHLPVCELYSYKKRLGCILCPMATKKSKIVDIERYPGFVKAYKRAFKIIIQKRIARGNPFTWKNEDEMFHWWIYGKQPNVV